MSEATQKAYLGDGVYASVANGMLRLTTENGLHVTNEIWLEPEVLAALQDYLSTLKDHHMRKVG